MAITYQWRKSGLPVLLDKFVATVPVRTTSYEDLLNYIRTTRPEFDSTELGYYLTLLTEAVADLLSAGKTVHLADLCYFKPLIQNVSESQTYDLTVAETNLGVSIVAKQGLQDQFKDSVDEVFRVSYQVPEPELLGIQAIPLELFPTNLVISAGDGLKLTGDNLNLLVNDDVTNQLFNIKSTQVTGTSTGDNLDFIKVPWAFVKTKKEVIVGLPNQPVQDARDMRLYYYVDEDDVIVERFKSVYYSVTYPLFSHTMVVSQISVNDSTLGNALLDEDLDYSRFKLIIDEVTDTTFDMKCYVRTSNIGAYTGETNTHTVSITDSHIRLEDVDSGTTKYSVDIYVLDFQALHSFILAALDGGASLQVPFLELVDVSVMY